MYLEKIYYLFFFSCPVVLSFFLLSIGINCYFWRKKISPADIHYTFKSVFWQGEYYRLFSCLFYHSDLSHFLVNILSLIGLSTLEEKIGSWTLFVQLLAAPIVIKLLLSGIYSFVYSKYPADWILEIPVLGLSSFMLAFVTTHALTTSKDYYDSIDSSISDANTITNNVYPNGTSIFTTSNSSFFPNGNSSYTELISSDSDFVLKKDLLNSSSIYSNYTDSAYDVLEDLKDYPQTGIIFDDDPYSSSYDYHSYENTIVLFGFMEIPAFIAPVFFLMSSHLIVWKSNLLDNFSGMFVGILIAGGSFNFLQNLYWCGCFLFWVISISLYSIKPNLIFSMLPIWCRRSGSQYIQVARHDDSDFDESDEENQLNLSDSNSSFGGTGNTSIRTRNRSNHSQGNLNNLDGVELTSFTNRSLV